MRSIIDDDNQKTYIKCFSCRARRLFLSVLTLQLKGEIRGICASDEFARIAVVNPGISSIVKLQISQQFFLHIRAHEPNN